MNFTISFAGDCTLGNYAGQAYDGSFNQEYKRQGSDPTYFLKKNFLLVELLNIQKY